MIEVWRIVKKKYSTTAFDGEGARISGGRWNHDGVSMVYTSSTLSLAALELFVNLDGPPHMALVSIPAYIPKECIFNYTESLPAGWNAYPASNLSKDIGTHWIQQAKSAVLQVPSVIIPSEFNYLLNPNHLDFQKITIGSPSVFSFDPRMWKT